MAHYLTTFEIEVDVQLNDIERQQAMRVLNRYHTGKEKPEFITLAQAQALYASSLNYRRTLTVGLRPDGKLEVINDDD
jgi:hypothetical protein